MSAPPSSLQQHFALTLAQFIVRINALGWKVTFGEAYRPPELAQLYAQQGRGIANSLHTVRLAMDLNVFDKDNNYISDTKDLETVGAIWEAQDSLATWGGRFGDGNHFSFGFEGRR